MRTNTPSVVCSGMLCIPCNLTVCYARNPCIHAILSYVAYIVYACVWAHNVERSQCCLERNPLAAIPVSMLVCGYTLNLDLRMALASITLREANRLRFAPWKRLRRPGMREPRSPHSRDNPGGVNALNPPRGRVGIPVYADWQIRTGIPCDGILTRIATVGNSESIGGNCRER